MYVLTTLSVFALDLGRPQEQKGTRWVSSTASSPKKWDWDWSSRPVSALSACRVESLLSKFDAACAGGRDHSISMPKASGRKRASVAGPAGSAARPAAVGGTGPRTVVETAVAAAATAAVLEESATTGEATREDATANPPPPAAGLAAKEREGDATLSAAADEAGVAASAANGPGRGETAGQKKGAAVASKGGKVEGKLGEERRGATPPKEPVLNPDVSRLPGASPLPKAKQPFTGVGWTNVFGCLLGLF